jgi:hypothetical protein
MAAGFGGIIQRGWLQQETSFAGLELQNSGHHH